VGAHACRHRPAEIGRICLSNDGLRFKLLNDLAIEDTFTLDDDKPCCWPDAGLAGFPRVCMTGLELSNGF
jgi:hypothetical protein